MDLNDPHGPRQRLLVSGKELFARHGYDRTSTSAITRSAGTSESQLVRHFQGKAGLLEAILEESFAPLNQQLQTVITGAASTRDAILGIISTVVRAFDTDPDLASLCLFEGRRVRLGQSEISQPRAFLEFGDLLRLVIRGGRQAGTLSDRFRDSAVAFALMGAAEAMVRERVIAHRGGEETRFSVTEITEVLEAMIAGLSSVAAPSAKH